MKLGNKSELIEHVFRKQETHLAYTYTCIFKETYLKKKLHKTTDSLRMFCRYKFFLLELTVYQSISSACTIFLLHL
jgi:hypothetical protein